MVIRKILAEKGNFGFNAEKLQFSDLVEDGVIDPTKVVRIAVENATSIAGLLLTTECAISEKPKEEEKEKK